MNFPVDRRYTTHDEWVRLEGDQITIGITEFAQDALGELVHVEMPEVGDTLDAGEAVCEVESVKAVAEVYTPLAGEVVEINEDLDGAEDIVNSDPHGAGWLVKLRVESTDLSALLDAAAYAQKVSQG